MLACPACRSGDAERDAAAWRQERNCIDESHLSVNLVRCPACGGRALRIFTELIDWSEGDDSQATLLVPLPTGDPGTLSEEAGVAALLARLPPGTHLARIYPKGLTTPPTWIWRQGRAHILPHD
jgi:hypothetical protein